MDIRISRENMAYWAKKGALGFRFEITGKDGVIVSQGGRHTCVLKIDEPEKPARHDSQAKRSDSGGMTRRKLILLARRVVQEALAKKYTSIVLDFRDFKRLAGHTTNYAIAQNVVKPSLGISDRELAELLAVNFLMAQFEFRDYLSKPKEGFSNVSTIILINANNKEIQTGIKKGIIIGEEVNRSRHIATMPGGKMTPEILAAHARESVKGLPVKVSVLDEKAMEKLKMGGILGVGKGSDAKPCFIILEYWGASDKKEKPIVLVGKGVTFDTGGLNLKPTDSILGMNMDMSGGAAVIHTLAAAARLKLKKNVIALIPAVENMPSGSSYRPGDVLRSMSGKTIEVLNTDAEGRIILADALHYAKRYKPSLVVDVATLTGA